MVINWLVLYAIWFKLSTNSGNQISKFRKDDDIEESTSLLQNLSTCLWSLGEVWLVHHQFQRVHDEWSSCRVYNRQSCWRSYQQRRQWAPPWGQSSPRREGQKQPCKGAGHSRNLPRGLRTESGTNSRDLGKYIQPIVYWTEESLSLDKIGWKRFLFKDKMICQLQLTW